MTSPAPANDSVEAQAPEMKNAITDAVEPHCRSMFDKAACVLIGAGATALPILLLLAQNGQRIADREIALETAGLAALFAGVTVIVLQRFFDWRVAGLTVAAFGYTFFLNSWVPPGSQVWERFALWLGMAVFGTIIIRTLVGESSAVLRIMAGAIVACGAFLAIAGLQSGDEGAPTELALSTFEPVETPNVYVFVMDGLSRVDLLRSEFPGIDIEDSIDRLEDLGFTSSDISTSNYARTHLSIPAMLSGGYHATNENRPSLDSEWDFANARLSGDNRLVQTLKGAGYEYWHAESQVWGHASCSTIYAAECIGSKGDPETVAALWQMTPFETSPQRQIPQDPRRVVDYVLDNPSNDPRILFAHILSPHNPYKFDAECNDIWIGSLSEGWQPSYAGNYVDETECLMTMLADSMDRLIEADPDAMILLLSDHGHSFGVNWGREIWPDKEVEVRFSNFRMARVPERCQSDDFRAHSLINVNELVTSCLSQTEPDWQDVRLFTSSDDGVLEISEEQLTRVFGG